MVSLDTPVIWHTPSAVYTCTIHTLLKVVSGLMEGSPELCNNQYPFLRLLSTEVKTQSKRMLEEYGSKIVIIKAPRAGHDSELYHIEDIALQRLSKEQNVQVYPSQVIKGGAV